MLFCTLFSLALASCSDKKGDEPSGPMLTFDEASLDAAKALAPETTFCTLGFTARAKWTAEKATEGADWLKVLETSGPGGTKQSLRFELKVNSGKAARSAEVKVLCGNEIKNITITQLGSEREVMDPDDVPNIEKFFFPGDPNYAKKYEDMFYSDTPYNFFHYKQSEHFFVFWDARFGENPNGNDVPANLRVDVDDLLNKAEGFFHTNIEMVGMSELGVGKSFLDDFKMQIWIIYDEGWVATGSGYGDRIGALWVTPSTCHPVGSTIAHEIGHSFQYQVFCDKVKQGLCKEGEYVYGFRYGWGGNGGCGYWEQCAQWQSMLDYPAEQFYQDFNPWLANYHRHFNHEWMRYQSYWLMSYWREKRGIESYGKIWKESKQPDDPIMTYTRLYLGGDYDKFWDEYYDYASRMVTYDIDNVRQYRNATWGASSQYKTSMFKNGKGGYQVAYASCPETSGFNIIRLNVPKSGTVAIDFNALKPGDKLATEDPGQYKKGDNEEVGGTVRNYNNSSINTSAPDFRYGYVAIVNDKPVYGEVNHNAKGTAQYTVPTGTTELYFVVVPTPAKYNSHAWDVDDLNDAQWPYEITITGSDLFGNIDIDPSKEPEDLNLTYDLKCDASVGDYTLGSINLSTNGDLMLIAQALSMQPSTLAGCTLPISVNTTVKPTEGAVAFMLDQKTGGLAGTYTANGGFYITADGNVGSWGNGDPLWVEYNAEQFVLTFGHYPGKSEAGRLYKSKPCLVYVKNGKQYQVTFELNMQF